MDSQRELAVLRYITALWNRDVTDILDLLDGHFFLHVLHLLDHGSKDRSMIDTDENRLLSIKSFLQDFYGESVKLEDYLQFEIIFNRSNSSLAQTKMELAKIAVVLLGIGVLDKNGQLFMDAALQLPVDLQTDILALIQSVVLPDSTEVVLTNRIELALLTADKSSPPVLNILAADNFILDSSRSSSRTPCQKKFQMTDSSSDSRTPSRSNMSLLNRPFHDICSPFKSLDITSPYSPTSSPLIDFVRSPQVIQKAVLKQKDKELRKLHEQLSAEILLKEEAQLALREIQSRHTCQDAAIVKLQKRLLEVHSMEESHSELLELQGKYHEIRAELLSVKERVQGLQVHKEVLENENRNQVEEISRLNFQIKSLEVECRQHKEVMEFVEKLDVETKSQELQLAHLKKSCSQLEEERATYSHNLKTSREINKRLQNELEELQAKLSESTKPTGESMDVIVDIQIGELKCQLKERIEEKAVLEKKLEIALRELGLLKQQAEHDNQHMKSSREINTNLSHALKIERDTVVKMKKRMECLESKYEDVKMKLDNTLKDREDSVSTLRTAFQESEQQLQKYKQQLEFLLDSCHCKSPSEDRAHSDVSSHSLSDSLNNRQTSSSNSDSCHLTPRLSSGYDSSACSPEEILRDRSGVSFRRNPDSSFPTRKSVSTTQMYRSSTASLQSLQSLKEHLPCMLPNAFSCDSEPELQNFEWDRLSQMSVDADKKDVSLVSACKDSTEYSPVKSMKVKPPMKRGTRDENSTFSPKQRKSEGTVTYFPLDPNGPIYPPPLPPTHPRRISGRFVPTFQDTSNLILEPKTSCTTMDSYITSAGSLRASKASFAKSDTCGSIKLKPSSPQSQSKYAPARRSNFRLCRTYRYKVSKNSLEI